MAEKEDNSEGVQEAEFKIEASFRFFDQSFNRIKYFSSMANNLDISCLPKNWSIQNKDGLTYMVSAPQNDEEKLRLVGGYQHFIHCYLVRDCIESFALSLDKFCFMLLLNGKRIQVDKPLLESLGAEEKQFYKKFEKAGISSQEGKIQLLKSYFGVELPDNFSSVITSLKDIRNCFAHGNGFVRITDGKKSGKSKRKFIWNTISVFARGEDTGKIYPLFLGEPFPESVNVCVKIDEHIKSYDVGSQLNFSSAEAYEIAFSLQQISRKLIEKAAETQSIRKRDVA